jgi:hypothetical protein
MDEAWGFSIFDGSPTAAVVAPVPAREADATKMNTPARRGSNGSSDGSGGSGSGGSGGGGSGSGGGGSGSGDSGSGGSGSGNGGSGGRSRHHSQRRVRIADPPTSRSGHRYPAVAAYSGAEEKVAQAHAQGQAHAQAQAQAHAQVQAQAQAQAVAAAADAVAHMQGELTQLRVLSEQQSRLALTVLCITAAVAVVLLLATFQAQSRLHYTTECLLWHAKASRAT